MVKTVNSKRKLFPNSNKEQKENTTPDAGGADGSGGGGPVRPNMMPMSERQQIALLVQMSSPQNTGKWMKNGTGSSVGGAPAEDGSSSPDSCCRGGNTTTPFSNSGSMTPGARVPPNTGGSGGRGGCNSGGGTGISKRNERGETPLHVAAIRGDADRVHQLIARGADVNTTDYAGWTALHEACNRGFVSVARELIKAGAAVNAKGLDNETPLHDACVNNHFKIVEVLLENRASTTVVNRRGQTPSDVCRSPVIQALLHKAQGTSGEKCDSISSMSRRTPPSTKGDSKPQEDGGGDEGSPQSSAASSSQGGAERVTSGGVGPASPRVTLRLQHQAASARTPDGKTSRNLAPDKGDSGSDDPYEFKVKDDIASSSTKENSGSGKNNANSSDSSSSSQQPNTGEKRHNDDDLEDDTNKRKKRKDDHNNSTNTANNSNNLNSNKELSPSGQTASASVTGTSGNSGSAGGNSLNSTGKGLNRTGDKLPKALIRSNLPGSLAGGLGSNSISNNGGNSSKSSIGNSSSNSGNASANVSLSSSSLSATVAVAADSSSASSNNNTNSSINSLSSGYDSRKTAQSSAANSPKGVSAKQDKSDTGASDAVEDTTDRHDSSSPKVPPLKIVLSSCGSGTSSSANPAAQDLDTNSCSNASSNSSAGNCSITSAGSGKGGNSNTGNNSRQLPYVVPATSEAVSDGSSNNSNTSSRILLNTKNNNFTSISNSLSSGSNNNSTANGSNNTTTVSPLSSSSTTSNSNNAVTSSSTSNSCTSTTSSPPSTVSTSSPGGLSSTPSTAVSSTEAKDANSGGVKDEPMSPGGGDKQSGGPIRITRSQRGTGSPDDAANTSVKLEVKVEEPSTSSLIATSSSSSSSTNNITNSSGSSTSHHHSSNISPTTESIHPRKRKLNIKDEEPDQSQPPQLEQPLANCYLEFLKIRKQIDDRRKLLFPVQPKPPQGFKDYLMNRGTYVLSGNPASQGSVPIMPPPAALQQPLKELFETQEQDRYKLRLQHQVERERLVLSVEQEILRVHGRAARALANQVLPFSACTMLRDQEVYNILTPEQEEKHRNARSRYNGRLFISWLQDVDDKWEKIKESMVLRQQNEAESLNAVHRMDWEWKLKELGLCDNKSRPVIEELHVPMVPVSDFDLLPA